MADDLRTAVKDVPRNEMAREDARPSAPPSPPAPMPPAKSRRRLGLLVLGIVAVLAIVGFFVWRYLGTYESTDDAQVDGHVNAVSARVGGYVQSVNVEDNQYVQKGAVLVQIDPRDYQVAVDHAKAELADAEATARALSLNVPVETVGTTSQVSASESQLSGMQAGVTAAQRQSDAARSQLQEAEANNARAQADLARYKELVAKDEVSRQVYDQADAAAKASAAAVDAARAAVGAAEQQIAQAQGRLGQAEAELRNSRTGPQQVSATRARAEAALATVQEKRSALAQAELNLQYCTIAAPVSGVVNKNVEVGMNVQPGQTLLSIVPLDDVWITADFKETQLAHMRPGRRDDFRGRVFPQV